MVPRSIDNSRYVEIKKLEHEIERNVYKIHQLKEKIQSIRASCTHQFEETLVMRVCQKCGYSESTYY